MGESPLKAIVMATLLGGFPVLSQELSMMMLGQPPAHIRPPPKPHWLHLDYDLRCTGKEGVVKQPSEQSASRGPPAFAFPLALVLGHARSSSLPPSSRTVQSHDSGQSDPETERVRYIIVVVLAVMTVVCIGLTVGLVYLKRRYLKYQIHPDAPSEETNFLWNYHIRGLRWTRYRSSEQPPPLTAAPTTPIGLRPEFTEMALELQPNHGSKHGPASTLRLELRERCSTSSGISLSNSDVQEEPPDLVTSTLQPQMRPSIAELGEMMQCLAEGRLEDEEEEEEAAAIHEAPTLQLQRPLRQLRPLRDEVMPHAQTEEPNSQRRRRRRRQPRRRPPQPSSPSSSSPCSTLPRSRPPPRRSSSGHRRHSRSLGYETDNEIEV